MNNETFSDDSYDYCEHCDQLIWKPELDYYNCSSTSSTEDYEMDEAMEDLDFGIVPLGAIKRSRSEAGLEDNLQKPGSKKRQRLTNWAEDELAKPKYKSDPMEIDPKWNCTSDIIII